jgi:hypothetical protein
MATSNSPWVISGALVTATCAWNWPADERDPDPDPDADADADEPVYPPDPMYDDPPPTPTPPAPPPQSQVPLMHECRLTPGHADSHYCACGVVGPESSTPSPPA